jgi:hypothetical protein
VLIFPKAETLHDVQAWGWIDRLLEKQLRVEVAQEPFFMDTVVEYPNRLADRITYNFGRAYVTLKGAPDKNEWNLVEIYWHSEDCWSIDELLQ